MNGDDVLATWFWWRAYTGTWRSGLFPWGESQFRGSYGMREVDDLMRRVAAELDSGRPVDPLIRSATFRPGRGTARYEASAVDWFLEQFLAAAQPSDGTGVSIGARPDLPVVNLITWRDPHGLSQRPGSLSRRGRRQRQAETRRWLAEDCAQAWSDFDQLPGMHLRWDGLASGELRTAESELMASSRGLRKWTAGGMTFAIKQQDRRRLPDLITTEIAASTHRDQAGHFAAGQDSNAAKLDSIRALVDEFRIPVLYLSGANFAYRQCARITFPDRRWLRFWVRGTNRRNAIMTAVDQAGNKVIRYRERNRGIDIAVDPDQRVTTELVLAISTSARWLTGYFGLPD